MGHYLKSATNAETTSAIWELNLLGWRYLRQTLIHKFQHQQLLTAVIQYPSLTYAHPEEEATFSQTSVTQIEDVTDAETEKAGSEPPASSLPIPQVRLLLTGTPALVPTPTTSQADWPSSHSSVPQEILATATLVPPESTPTSTSAFMTETPHEPMDEEWRGRPRLLPQST
ncbi:hypothetical protein Pelo_18566 [Pelomyxa schiedti]|nr:hypothetical protein Pelo_18566 [Pelomyxa schiedti]